MLQSLKESSKRAGGSGFRAKKEQQEFIVAGLPNVNTAIAKRLLAEFKTVQGVFNATEAELEKVRGIGEKTAKEIRETVISPYCDAK